MYKSTFEYFIAFFIFFQRDGIISKTRRSTKVPFFIIQTICTCTFSNSINFTCRVPLKTMPSRDKQLAINTTVTLICSLLLQFNHWNSYSPKYHSAPFVSICLSHNDMTFFRIIIQRDQGETHEIVLLRLQGYVIYKSCRCYCVNYDAKSIIKGGTYKIVIVIDSPVGGHTVDKTGLFVKKWFARVCKLCNNTMRDCVFFNSFKVYVEFFIG